MTAIVSRLLSLHTGARSWFEQRTTGHLKFGALHLGTGARGCAKQMEFLGELA